MNWLHEVINSQGAADADASVKGFLASFMPIMRELRSGPISNFSTMARTLQDQHPELHAKIVVLLTFSMVFAECCDSLTTVFRSLTGEILSGFVGQASQCSDFLPVMLNIVAFVRDHGSLSAQGRQQLLRVTQDSLFWILNSPKVIGRYELSVETCQAILCGVTLSRVVSKDENKVSKNFRLIRESVKLLSENARFALLSSGLEHGHISIDSINELLAQTIQPAPVSKVYIPDFVMASYSCSVI